VVGFPATLLATQENVGSIDRNSHGCNLFFEDFNDGVALKPLKDYELKIQIIKNSFTLHLIQNKHCFLRKNQ